MTCRRLVLSFQVGCALLAGLCIFWLSHVVSLVDFVAAVQQRVMQLGFWSAICYSLLYAACTVLLLPGGVVSIGSGFFFGLWWGFLIILLGNVAGAALSFFLSRVVGGRWLRQKLVRYPCFEALDPAVRREGWKIILLSQLHPLFPTSLLNYTYGLTTIRFRTCMLWGVIGRAPGLFLYTYLGTVGQFGLNHFRGERHLDPVECVILGGGLVCLFLLTMVLSRIGSRLVNQTQPRSVAGPVDLSGDHLLEQG